MLVFLRFDAFLFMNSCTQVRNTDLSCRASAASLLRALCTKAKEHGNAQAVVNEEEEEEEQEQEEEDDEARGGDGDEDVDADGSLSVPPSSLGPQLPYVPCTDHNYLETFNGIATCQVRSVAQKHLTLIMYFAGPVAADSTKVTRSQRRQRPQ